METTETELKPQNILSPTSILTYLKCPREYYYNYILKLPIIKTIHLIKGSIVHNVLEDLFTEYREDRLNFVEEDFETQWNNHKKELEALELKPSQLEKHKQDAINMLKMYVLTFNQKITNLITTKAKDDNHAFNLLKPKFRELKLENDKIHLRGYIDRTYESFSGSVTISDYKTSSRYGVGIPENYKLQLGLYALLYYKETNEMPNYVSIIFLRYGEEVIMEVTPSLIKETLKTLDRVWNETRTTDLKDYPKKESKLCGWCSYQDKCNGILDRDRNIRKTNLLKLTGDLKEKAN